MASIGFGQARVAAAGVVLAVFAGAAGLWGAPVHAQSASVTNVATVAAPAGTEDSNPGNETDSATVTISAAAPYSFCAAPGGSATSNAIYSIVNGVAIARYEPGAGSDAAVPELALPSVGGDVNALMIDAARDRLLFHTDTGATLWAYDADNGGWYAAATGVTGNFPRGGMAPDGVGYLMTGGASPQVWRITPSGAFGYAVANIGTLTYDFAPQGTNTSGDLAFDANGDGWLLVGRDLFRVDFDTLAATRQTRPLIGGVVPNFDFAGVAFADDGTLYLANNQGGGGSAYHAYDPVTGELASAVPTSAGGSRDLASCAFPVPAEPELSVVKTLAEVNGAPYVDGNAVAAGDTLTWHIDIANDGGAAATLYPGTPADVAETVPVGTTHAGGDDFTCAGTAAGAACGITSAVNIPGNGGSATLAFRATVDTPLPAGLTAIANAVTFPNDAIDCTATGNDCEELTPLGPATSVAKASNPASGAAVGAGDTIDYTLTVTVANAATTEAITLVDTLGAGLTLSDTLPAGCTASGQVVTCVLAAGAAVGTHEFEYSATVDGDATGTVGNVVVPSTPPGGDPDPDCTSCETEHPLAPATTVAKTSNPASGAAVAVGQTIAYTLTVGVANAATTEAITLTDTLGAGLTLSGAPPAGCSASGQVLTCVLAAGAAVGTHTFDYAATVDADATGTVGNTVVPSTPPGGDPDPDCTTCTTEHPLTPATAVAKTSNPASGAAVAAGQTIAYTLTVSVANSAITEAITLTDTLGAGLTLSGAPPAGCSASGQVLTCVLAAGTAVGTHTFDYAATVDGDATGTVGNVVVPSTPPGGDPDPDCTTCETGHPLTPVTAVAKTSMPASGTTVAPGDSLAYTLSVTVVNADTTEAITLTDTLGAGLTLSGALPAGCSASGQVVTCVLASGATVGTHTFTYEATVDADATGTVGNVVVPSTPPGGDPDPGCTTCSTDHPVEPTSITVVKSADPAPGTEVSPGDTLTYTLTVTVATSATTEVLTLVDALGEGLGFGEVTDTGAFACTGALTCTLPAGTVPGSYALSYTATVDADASGTLRNVVTASNPPGGTDPDPECTTCTTEHVVEPTSITVAKSSDPAPGSEVAPGDTLAYTLTVTVANSATTQVLTLVDTLGEGLGFGEVTDAGAFACTGSLTCTLPAGAVPGTYALTYTATVDADATGTLGNVVTAGNPPGGDPEPECTTCATEHEVIAPVVTVTKSSNPGSDTPVRAGDLITYTLQATVEHSATREVLTLDDTLGEGLGFGEVTDAGAFACTGTLTCTLPSGTLPGTYALTYTATVDADATVIVSNVVAASGGTGTGGQPPTCASCNTQHPLVEPRIVIAKQATPGEDQEVGVGDIIEYTLTATVENSATRADVRLVDTPGPGLALGALPAGCAAAGTTVVCTLPTGTVPGDYAFTYPATVTADASGSVENVVVGESTDVEPECTVCETSHELADDALLRIVKSVAVRNVAIGDLVRYTLAVENIGAVNVTGATLVDTPPDGFSYVEGSMAVTDRDGAFTLDGRHPLRIGGLDIEAGGQATIVYLLRVGAGVRAGMHVNEAVAVDAADTPISNVATAQVALDADPLLDDSLVFGTVFDDRDGDGWQDRADLGDVRVQGGFAPAAYVAGSTTIDRGDGPQPVADASAPLLHGIDVGTIAARQSEADPVEARQVVIRQRLRSADFTGELVLTSAQGATLRMDAAGNTTLERSGEAAKGLNAAEPTVERVVSAVEGGFDVAYVIANAGIDERGIPGVRIASVEGVLIETDQYGRYHLADVHGGDWGHGRNFILKVDPATLPPGTPFTTANPLVRRVTPGLPVRFDFGVQLPVQVLPGGERRVELELGEVIFQPGSAEVREAYLPAIAEMAEQVERHRGGEVVITADGDSEGLAFARAAAVRDALQAQVPAEAQAGLSVVLRTRVEDPHSLVAGVDAGGALLGTALFDTDQSRIRPEFESLLDAVAKRLEQLGGGVVAIVGHTDVRGSHAYNAALGLRRASAVQQALAQRLSPEVRAQVRVEASSDPAAPVGTERR
ncbi:OmpA family protein [Luteimonas kalidii]|uniref:OmpA family protein n=1 Tax=Luteimonas kalidii TaxID=3042025 RepID=A0ABT6JWM7_9GAMM|nr:OmpA family protein [Luteimonas kalidii]MDH5835099.1 OmpA family protein [Luteimonas kalidii]